MPNRIDSIEERAGLDEKAASVLARLSARALEARGLPGIDDRKLAEYTEALESLAWPSASAMERLDLWLGADHAVAARRARGLRGVLEACAIVTVYADPAHVGPVMGALHRFADHLEALVEARREAVERDERDGNRVVLELLQRRIAALPGGQGLGLLLVHCAAVDQVDALRGLRAGEAVVRQIRHMLHHQVLRASDTVEVASRDEFACVLQPVSSEGVAILAAQKIFRLFETPIEVEDFAVAAEPHIGIALFPEHGRDAEQLLQHAKAALRAARAGHESISLYRVDAPGTQFDESRYAARLRHAIHNNGLQLHYQPQADFRSGRIIGAEALLRWNDEQLGAVPPNIAVAVAESTGLINDLTLWVITSAVQQCAAFRALKADFTVSVNISPSNLHEADLAPYVGQALRTWDVSSKGLIFEVTETAILSDQKLAMEALNELKRLGTSIGIDDFGTGYSSMYYLAQMPLDELKIDLMFVRQMLELPQHAKIVRSLIELAHNLELTVVAEGVENEAIWSALQHLGCDRAQGWYVGKPIPAGDLMNRLRQNDSALPAK